jgi:hypothetical protein
MGVKNRAIYKYRMQNIQFNSGEFKKTGRLLRAIPNFSWMGFLIFITLFFHTTVDITLTHSDSTIDNF